MQRLQPQDESLFLIENVEPRLPAAFDLGEHQVASRRSPKARDKTAQVPGHVRCRRRHCCSTSVTCCLLTSTPTWPRGQRPPGQSQPDHLPRSRRPAGDGPERLAGLDSIRSGSAARQALESRRCAETASPTGAATGGIVEVVLCEGGAAERSVDFNPCGNVSKNVPSLYLRPDQSVIENKIFIQVACPFGFFFLVFSSKRRPASRHRTFLATGQRASCQLVELKGIAASIPNQGILINTLAF